MLIRVVAPHFVAGLIIENDICTEAAPILQWAKGWTRDRLRDYFSKKGWKASVINEKAPVDTGA